MPVYKLKKSWAFKINYKNNQIWRSGFKTKNEAALAEIQVKIQLDAGSFKNSIKKTISSSSLDATFKEYLDTEYKVTTSYSYYNFYQKHVARFFAVSNINDLSNLQLLNYIKYVNRLKNVNKGFFITIAKIYLNFLKKHGTPELDLSLLKLKRSMFTEKRTINFYNLDEFKKYEASISDDRVELKLLFNILFYYGLRIGELKGLQHQDFDLHNKVLRVRRQVTIKTDQGKQVVVDLKTNSSRRDYPLIDHIIKLYKKTFKGYIPKKDFLFPYGETTINRYNLQISTKAELKKLRLHEFRHSCASYLINSGMDYLQVANWLGHKSASTTLAVYSHLFPSRKQDIADFINKNV